MPELPEWPARVIVRVALGTGARLNERLTLTPAQLDFGRGQISVMNTKTGKPRTVPMTAEVRSALQDALRLRGDVDSAYLFPGPYKPWQPISDYAVRSAFKAACAHVGIKGLRFHDLRHTAATRMAEGGAPMVDIRAVLGHASINMTARYAHSTDDGKRRAVEATARNPGHKLVTSGNFNAAGGGGK